MRATFKQLLSAAASERLKRVPSLQNFIQRGRALQLWRDVLRATARSPNRTELRAWARGEFERHRHVEDVTHIRYLISVGRKELLEMSRYTSM